MIRINLSTVNFPNLIYMGKVTLEELRHIVGELDDARIVAVLELDPTTAEVEDASLWANRQGDMLGRQGHPLEGKAALIFDILAREEDEEDAARR